MKKRSNHPGAATTTTIKPFVLALLCAERGVAAGERSGEEEAEGSGVGEALRGAGPRGGGVARKRAGVARGEAEGEPSGGARASGRRGGRQGQRGGAQQEAAPRRCAAARVRVGGGVSRPLRPPPRSRTAAAAAETGPRNARSEASPSASVARRAPADATAALRQPTQLHPCGSPTATHSTCRAKRRKRSVGGP
jgi:hypothetical protein